jgi:hypothetical protein
MKLIILINLIALLNAELNFVKIKCPEKNLKNLTVMMKVYEDEGISILETDTHNVRRVDLTKFKYICIYKYQNENNFIQLGNLIYQLIN